MSASAASYSPIASIRFKCCSPFVSASAAAPRLHPLQLLLAACIRINCCSPIASASTASRLCQLRLLLPDRVHFNCCSPIASALTAALRLHASACSPAGFQPMPGPNFLKHSSQSSRLNKLNYEGCVSLVQSCPTNIPLPSCTDRHTHTHTHTMDWTVFLLSLY